MHNLFDYFDDTAGEDGDEGLWALRAPFRPREGFDVLLVPRVPEWQDDPESRTALEQLESEPWVDDSCHAVGSARLGAAGGRRA